MQVLEENNKTIPKIDDLNNPELSKIRISYYIKQYGSFNKFLKSIGEPLAHHKYTYQELIDNYYTVKKKLGRIPTTLEMKNRSISSISSNTYTAHFGSWNKFLTSMCEVHLVKCIICGISVIKNYYKQSSKYCSKKCKEKGHNINYAKKRRAAQILKIQEIHCQECDLLFKPPYSTRTFIMKFCSRRCSVRYNARKYRQKKKSIGEIK